ncbi:hypothetical protein ACIA49_38570 [Kribbella sp. NPDC051587]|uniref:hypothetical protein n=1 Tax=Kribbella sp. NPDC051587 TaxID=3364119 RepID=UPI00379FD824
MNDYMRDVSSAAQGWADSFDPGSAGINITDLVIRDPYGEEPLLELPLQELVSNELHYVLRADTAARTNSAPATRGLLGAEADTGEALRHAAARLDQLTSTAEIYGSGVDRGWPADAAAALHETSRVSELLAELVTYTTGPVTESLSKGRVVALPAPGASDVPNQSAVVDAHREAAEAIAGLLGDVAAKLQDLSSQVARLQHTTSAVPGADKNDGPTLDTETVLEWRMPGYSNDCRFHIRVFRPDGQLPVVVMGQMGDHHSQSIMNCVEEVAAVVGELLLDGAAHDTVQWVQMFPPGSVGGPSAEAGLIQAVGFAKPYGSPNWNFLTHDELENLAGGPVRRWHSSGYTVPAMTQRGIPIVHPETRRYRPPRQADPTTTGPVATPQPDPGGERTRPEKRWWQRRRDQ